MTVLGVGDAFSGHDAFARPGASAAGLGGTPMVLTHSPDLLRLGAPQDDG